MFKSRSSLGKGKIIVGALVILLFSAFTINNLQAQMTTAVLSGTAMDTTGAVVAGVKIDAKSVGTGISYVTTTDGQGHYSIQELQVGTYDVSAQRSGFQKVVQTGIVMSVGAHSELDFTLKVGRTDEVVEVHGQASAVDTSTASVGQLVAPDQMANLPLNGRNFTDLLTLSPGVATVPMTGGGGGQSATAYGSQTNYSVSGSRPEGLQYLLDGTDIRGALDHGAGVTITGASLGMDAIQEFSVMTNTYGAQFGGTGAAINAVSKSGTNDMHGSGYEFIRNSALDAMNYFDAPGVKPSFKRNQFGGTLGGPIIKNKAFYFINYEGLRSGQGQTARGVVPITDSNPTDYTLFTDNGMEPNGSGGYVGTGALDPTTAGVPMPSLMQQIFALLPASQSLTQCPNVTDIAYQSGEGLACSVGTLVQNEDYGLARVDYALGPNDGLFGRYDIENAYQSVPYSTNIFSSAIAGYPEIDNERNQYTTIEERHVFSPKILNEARLGVVRLNLLTADGGKNTTKGPSVSALDQVPGRESMQVNLGGGLSAFGALPSSPSHDVMNRYSAGDDVTMTFGVHSIHLGATYTREQTNDYWLQYSGGDWIFDNLTGIPGAYGTGGSLYGSDLMGINLVGPGYTYTDPSGKTFPIMPERAWRQNLLSPYIQDDWKISKQLTINLGVRYEWASNPTTANGSIFVLPGETTLGKDSILTTTPGESSFVNASHLFTSNPNVKNIDPHIGLAYDPFADHKTSIRAGFATYHEPVTSRTFAFMAPNPTEPLTEDFFSTIFPALDTTFSQASNSIIWFYGLLPTVDKAPYVVQYNLTVQRQLWRGALFNIGYNGSTGVHLFEWINANPVLAYGDVTSAQLNAGGSSSIAATFAGSGATGQGTRGTVTNPFVGLHENSNLQSYMAPQPEAHSSYNSLQTSLTRQFSGALAGNVSYTWSKCLDNASASVSSEQGEYAIFDPYNPSMDRGPCSFNSNQLFSANAIYSLPFHGNRALNGWQISPIFSYFKGLPINVQGMWALYQSNINGATEGERPNLVPGCNPMVRKVTQWYNPACFVLQPFGTSGDVGRDSLNNPNYFDWDFAFIKETKLTERVHMQLRAEFFDMINHPNFSAGSQTLVLGTAATETPTSPNYSHISNPDSYALPSTTNPLGGVLCDPSQNGIPNGACYSPSTGLSATVPSTMGGQREIQFAVRLSF